MKRIAANQMLILILSASSMLTGCSAMLPMLGGLSLTEGQGEGAFLSAPGPSQGNLPYRAVTNPVQQDGKLLYGYY